MRRLVALAGHLAGERWSRYVAEEYGLTPAGAAVLMALARQRKLPHGDLADLCYVRPATLTGVVDTLVRSGHVERLSDESDRRAVWIALTNSGAKVASKVQRRVTGRAEFGGTFRGFALTSVETDPEQEAIVRRFLIELITQLSDNEEENVIRS